MGSAPQHRDAVELGAALRRARENAGLTTADVATRLKLREAFVIAVEEGDGESQMPDPYYTSHVRSIAELLGVPLE